MTATEKAQREMGIHDPVFLRASAAGSAGIAALILDGKSIVPLLQPFVRSKKALADAVSGDLLYARLCEASGRTIDEVILAPLSSKQSWTGNEQIELSCHGGLGVLQAIEELLIGAGFGRAHGTALLERAHLNARLSLIAIEARLRLSSAATALQADFLLSHNQFQQKWERLGLQMGLGMRGQTVEWREEIFVTAKSALMNLPSARALLARHHIAIIGPVNAGKSTLANALARAERHIVSEIPGTTLDRIDTAADLLGLNVLLSDTAGMRDADDELEREGQRRAAAAAESAALQLIVLDGSQALSEAHLQILERLGGPNSPTQSIMVLNKTDLGVHESMQGLGFLMGKEPLMISAQSGAGMTDLEAAIARQLLKGNPPPAGSPFTSRHQAHLESLQAGSQAGQNAPELLDALRKLVGTRPDADELAVVLRESRNP